MCDKWIHQFDVNFFIPVTDMTDQTKPDASSSELSILDGHASNIASMNCELQDSMARMITEMMSKRF